MPSTITHAYFGLDVYDRLEDKVKKNLKGYLEQIKTFSQGPDLFYFYHFLQFGKDNKVKDFGGHVHRNKTKAFFINIIKYLKDNNLTHNYELISCLYGLICHYALDATAHPFIFYKTGIWDVKKKETYKYVGLHNDMEAFIDAYLIHLKEHIEPKDFKAYKFCFNTKASSELRKMLNNIFMTTYNKAKMGDIYIGSIKRMKRAFYIFRHDPLGIKKQVYKFFDLLLPYHSPPKKETLSYNMDYKAKEHYLNLEKKEWNYPVDRTAIYNYSFIELYCIALHKAVDMINAANEVLYNDKPFETLDSVFLNLSYTNGYNCELKLKQKYFEF